MNEAIKVMLCDDSSTMRRLIKTALNKEPRFEIVYEAKDGQDAVDNIGSCMPDILVMDIEMPVMDGIIATTEIRKRQPRLPIVMFSSLTSRGAEATLDALAAGANDFALKPAASGHINNALEQLETDLVPKILKHAAPRTVSDIPDKQDAATSKPYDFEKKIDAVAIGVSTGGPDTLAKLLGQIPVGCSTPILITQHMPPVFTKLLAKRLSRQTGHEVAEASDGELIKPGRILIAPGDFHMTVRKSATKFLTRLGQEDQENSCRPAVDPLFRSVAECYGNNALGVVLTGMGRDGTQGSSAIKSRGGSVFVQDKSSSVVWGMPGKVVEAGLADRIYSLNQIADAISKTCDRVALTNLS